MDLNAMALALASSAFGLAYLTYGKKRGAIWFALAGVCLLICPYFSPSNTAMVIAILGFMVGPFFLPR